MDYDGDSDKGGRQDQERNNFRSKADKIQEKAVPSKLKLSKVCIYTHFKSF
jgi:hypothetical protein